jgi:hypothetical protein
MDGVSQGATESAAVPGKFRVFISYSRDDLDFADQLDVALRLQGFETSLDRHAISGGEEWKQRLANLIRQADTVVFVLSPTSAVSQICAWEVEEAARLGKRTIPVVSQPLDGASAPARLQDLNYIFFYREPKSPDSGWGFGQARLVEALNTDLEWLREHTRLLLRATEWDTGGRAENRLLSGSDIAAAKAWAARRPKGAPAPTAQHLEFIRASEEAEDARLSAQRKQLEDMTAAQHERAKALLEAEHALSKTIRLQRRQAWAATIIVVVLATIGWWAYGVIVEQRAVAREAERDDIRGQIVAYSAAFGSMAFDQGKGSAKTSLYTTPLVQKLGQRKNLMEAIADAHQEVLELSKGKQRPLLSTSMNGQIYLHQQPATRRKHALAVSVDERGDGYRIVGPRYDVDAIVATLINSGFSRDDVTTLHNPDRGQIEDAIRSVTTRLHQATFEEPGRSAPLTLPPLIRVNVVSLPEQGSEAAPYAPDANAAPSNTLFFFFYSGFGLHIRDTDYLAPKSVNPDDELNEVEKRAISVKWLMQTLERSAAASVIILDTDFFDISVR